MSRNNPKVKSLVEWVRSDNTHAEIAKALPSSIAAPDRESFVKRLERSFTTAIEKNAKLQQCTKLSIARCVLELVEFGLMPNGYDAHLIPYNRKQADGSYKLECSLIVDYKGFVRVLRDYAKAQIVDGNVVYDGDEFEFIAGGNEDGSDKLIHKPTFPRGAAEPIAVYTRVKFADSPVQIHVMDIADVENKRQRSKSFKSGPNQSDPDDMRKRTCLKNMMKWLPRTDEFTRMVDMDNRHDPVRESENEERLSAEIKIEEKADVQLLDNATADIFQEVEALLEEKELNDAMLYDILEAHRIIKPGQSWRDLGIPTLRSIIEKFDTLVNETQSINSNT